MRSIVFDPKAFQQFNTWAIEDKKVYQKIVKLINDILRQPFSGIGKPEPLKSNLSGYWSRRITDEHRLVYRVNDSEIIIISCKFHYDTLGF
ncbi:Txe/YoeB family addiction module toxin [Gloeocapsa sp. PCC 73106]|uniref:Txe/YoeB family addiction module toxin n=1 Tax=Gloeocapsa sp. PCC 73106 TaxID=102232 RepID=UPI0002ACF487|nr:Txe/YoeB family addiction module toxin [Gloeocapsa sp. PCC 73106]ELR96881.1 toxin-antitoxin system, toxin component, Txe/YoeB family [Gloeocapsa sp. PCC 73106]